jgi:hypothetical protein
VLQTETSTLSNLRSERAIKDLPLNSRNFAQLIGLAAGAMPAQTQQAGSPITMKRGVTGYAINGTRPEENNFLLDGINNNENHNGLGVLIFPPIDAVQEFRVESSVANAQFGRGGGGTINLTYKGTKQVDLLLFKEFYLSEGGARRIQFRSEFFSITNTPQFNNPAATVGAAGAGSIRAAGSPLTFQRTSRQIQFALKVYFCSRDVTGAETSRTIVKSPPEV